MTREDINDIIKAVCPNDEDYEKPCISPKYLRQELEQLALDQKQWNGESTTKNDSGVDECISKQEALDACHNFAIGILDNYYEKCLKQWIIDLPPVTPQEPILDKIIAEIKQNAYPIVHGCNSHELGMTLYGILQIIDKYKRESEGTDT